MSFENLLNHQLNHQLDQLRSKYQTNHYTNFLKDKCVIIVGPDTNLKGKKLGKYIDSFDVVIRHNTVLEYLPFTKDLSEDYGSRTDVLYQAPQCIKDYSNNYQIWNSTLGKLKIIRPKFIVYQNGNRDYKYITGTYCFPEHLDKWKKHLSKLNISMHYSHKSSQSLTEIMTQIKHSERQVIPRIGFISIFDMLIHQPKYVEVVGMSFYHGGGHAFRSNVKQPLDPLLNAKFQISAHDSFVELELMKLFLEKFPSQLKWQSDLIIDSNTSYLNTSDSNTSDN